MVFIYLANVKRVPRTTAGSELALRDCSTLVFFCAKKRYNWVDRIHARVTNNA